MYSQWDAPTLQYPPDHQYRHQHQRPSRPYVGPIPQETHYVPTRSHRQDRPYRGNDIRPHRSSRPSPNPPNLAGVELLGQGPSGPSGFIMDDRAWRGVGGPEGNGHIGLGFPTLLGQGQHADFLRVRSPEGAPEMHDATTLMRHDQRQGRKVSPQPQDHVRELTSNPLPPHISTPINRSWTLDSGARSNLTPFEATHLGRPLTRSPYPRNISPAEYAGVHHDRGPNPEVKRYRGLPKALLGGPNGKTYEELRAGNSRIVSAPARTPPPRAKQALEEVQDAQEEKTSRLRSSSVAVRLPPSRYSPPDPPAPPVSATGSSSSDSSNAAGVISRKEAFPWPEPQISVSPTGIPLPLSPLSVTSPGAKPDVNSQPGSAMAKGKEVVVAVPKTVSKYMSPKLSHQDSWEKLASRHSSTGGSKPQEEGVLRMSRVSSGQVTDQHDARRRHNTSGREPHGPNGSVDSQDVPILRPAAAAFQPRHSTTNSIASQIGHYESVTPRVGQLHPFAPPFQPPPKNQPRRVVSTSGPGCEGPEGPKDRRIASDASSDGSLKRLRPNAAPFQPNSSGHISRTSVFSPTEAHLNPAAPAFSPDYIGRNIPIDVTPNTWPVNQPDRADDYHLSTDPDNSCRGDGTRSKTVEVVPLRGGSSMKRSSSGRLRPVAASFVPTGQFTFQFGDPASARPSEPGPNRRQHAALDSSSPAVIHQLQPAGPQRPSTPQTDVKPAPFQEIDQRSGSPAAMLHDLSDNEEHRIHIRQHKFDSLQYEGVDSVVDEWLQQNIRDDHRAHSSSRSSSPAFSLDRHSLTPLCDSTIPLPGPNSIAHLPTESFGLPSPRPQDKDSRPTIAAYPDVFTVAPDVPRQNDLLSIGEPQTPTGATIRGSTTEPYETVDGSPLLPRRHLDTPATPHKTASGEAKNTVLVSPTPARKHHARQSMFDESETASEADTDTEDLLTSREAVQSIPTQPNITVDTTKDDTKFRNWIFPASPGRRPSFTRRYTFPVPAQEQAGLPGIASTATLATDNPATRNVPLHRPSQSGLDVPPPVLSTRTSVEFPMRPDKRNLAVVNAVPGEAEPSGTASPELTARPRLPHNVGGQEVDGRGDKLDRLEGLLRRLSERLDGLSETSDGEGSFDMRVSLSRFGEDLVGMIAELRTNINDRLDMRDNVQAQAFDLHEALQAQEIMLRDLLRRSSSSPILPDATMRAEEMSASFSTLLSCQASLLSQLTHETTAHLRQSREIQTAVEALQAAKEDLELRKLSDAKKDDIISALQSRVDEMRISAGIGSNERSGMQAKLDALVTQSHSWEREKRDLVLRLSSAQDREKVALARADEMEASKMALQAERDGLARGLRESFDRVRHGEAEVDELRQQLELLSSRVALHDKDPSGMSAKLDQLAAQYKTSGDTILAGMARLTKDMSGTGLARQQEIEGLKEDKRILQTEVAELRKKSYEAASRIADADLRAATAANAAASREQDLQRSLDETEQAKAIAENRVAGLEADLERLKLEKLDVTAIATERSGAMRVMEMRHQALIQENGFWREFALSYDRREYRKYVRSQPFRDAASSPVLQTPALPRTSEGIQPRDTPTTPTNVSFPTGAPIEGTPDLSMSVSTSAEGMQMSAMAPSKDRDEEGTEAGGRWYGLSS